MVKVAFTGSASGHPVVRSATGGHWLKMGTRSFGGGGVEPGDVKVELAESCAPVTRTEPMSPDLQTSAGRLAGPTARATLAAITHAPVRHSA